MADPTETKAPSEFPYLPDDSVVSVQRGPSRAGSAAPTAPSARPCAG